MSVHQCPKCELRFAWKTELDDHCRQDHPAFHHEYPATAPVAPPAPVVMHPDARPRRARLSGDQLFRWLVPRHPNKRQPVHHAEDT